MSYQDALDTLERMIAEARSVPLSASAVIPREEALNLIAEIKATLPEEHARAREVLGERERVLSEAQRRAEGIIEQARAERAQLVSRAEVVQAAESEARGIVEQAHATAEQLAHQADDYIDAKLANFEILLDKMQRTIAKGRDQLRPRLDAAREVQPLDLEDSGEISNPLVEEA